MNDEAVPLGVEFRHDWKTLGDRRLAHTEFEDGNARTLRTCNHCGLVKITVHFGGGKEAERRAAYGPELPLVGDVRAGLESGPTWPDFRIAWCFYCGERPGWQREHKTPTVRGRTNAPDNIVRSCQGCNIRKGTMTLAEYRASFERRRGAPFLFFGERQE